MKLLPETRYGPVITVGDVAAARRCMLERSFDIVVINTPLPDDFGTELALDICESTGTGVLFFVRSDIYHDVNARVSPHGVLTVSKPAPVTAINQSLMILCGMRERLRRMKKDSIHRREDGGDPYREPCQAPADRTAQDDGKRGAPLHRKTRYGQVCNET